jgi:DNA-binding beta-propeller fold protein YncE
MRRIYRAAALLIAALSVSAAANPLLIIGNKGEDSVSFVDLETGRELARRETGRNPHEIAPSPDGKRVAVVAYGGGSIEIFDDRACTEQRPARDRLACGRTHPRND